MDNLVIIDEIAPFTQEDFEKVVAHIKKNDTAYQGPQKYEWYAKGQATSSTIYNWYMRYKRQKYGD